MGVYGHFSDKTATGVADETPEVLDGDDPDVRGVVPFIRKLPVFRRIPGKEDL